METRFLQLNSRASFNLMILSSDLMRGNEFNNSLTTRYARVQFSTPSRKKVTPPFQILLSVFQLPSYCAIPHDPPLAPLPHKAFLLRRRNVTPSFQILPPFCRSIRSIAQLNRFLYLPFGILFHHRQMQKTARGNPLLRPYYPRLKSPPALPE